MGAPEAALSVVTAIVENEEEEKGDKTSSCPAFAVEFASWPRARREIIEAADAAKAPGAAKDALSNSAMTMMRPPDHALIGGIFAWLPRLVPAWVVNSGSSPTD